MFGQAVNGFWNETLCTRVVKLARHELGAAGAILLSQKESLLEKEANTDNSRASRSRFLATPFNPHLEPAKPNAPEFFV